MTPAAAAEKLRAIAKELERKDRTNAPNITIGAAHNGASLIIGLHFNEVSETPEYLRRILA